MKKHNLFVGILSLLAAFALVLAACTSPVTETNENARLYGIWQNDAETDLEWEFYTDNSWAITKNVLPPRYPFISGSFFEFDGTILRAKQNGGDNFEGVIAFLPGDKITISDMKEYTGTWTKQP
jgi:hypothetical protein